jgi:hypothetical protein
MLNVPRAHVACDVVVHAAPAGQAVQLARPVVLAK